MSEKPTIAVLDLSTVNDMQVEHLKELCRRAKGAHHADILLRINGQDKVFHFEADWLKNLTFATRGAEHETEIERLRKQLQLYWSKEGAVGSAQENIATGQRPA